MRKRIYGFIGEPVTKFYRVQVDLDFPDSTNEDDILKMQEEIAFALDRWDAAWFHERGIKIVGPIRKLCIDEEQRDSPFFVAMKTEDNYGPESVA